ncbi:hypothetical protein P154DRAFT_100605 [Amniculicola lignicola CBS 123094]|uniref:Uncharacterized protein n=1 Tax=Amniculicola lignicola CBS 123094 TaxID=1392246 RepID=A0A6A5WNX9_9PLEO|nr:hypothetical protein P154DRAFT_100605 [Amniculicola lignicola CBS 123094]
MIGRNASMDLIHATKPSGENVPPVSLLLHIGGRSMSDDHDAPRAAHTSTLFHEALPHRAKHVDAVAADGEARLCACVRSPRLLAPRLSKRFGRFGPPNLELPLTRAALTGLRQHVCDNRTDGKQHSTARACETGKQARPLYGVSTAPVRGCACLISHLSIAQTHHLVLMQQPPGPRDHPSQPPRRT